MSDKLCPECQMPMVKRGEWKCPACDDVDLFSTDEKGSQDGESKVEMYSEDDTE